MRLYEIFAGNIPVSEFLARKLFTFSATNQLDLRETIDVVLISYGIDFKEFEFLDDYVKEKDSRIAELLGDLLLYDVSQAHRDKINRACKILIYARSVA